MAVCCNIISATQNELNDSSSFSFSFPKAINAKLLDQTFKHNLAFKRGTVMESKEEIIGTQFLSFILRDEHFAVEIFKVREVLDVTTLTRIPRMPDYLCGVINLRGNVVPVVDLGLKLGMDAFEKTVNTCIMIVEIDVEGESESVQMGVLSDGVQEVIDLNPSEIEPVPKLGSGLNTDFIKGMGRKVDKFLILLDINQVLSSASEMALRYVNETEGSASMTETSSEEGNGADT